MKTLVVLISICTACLSVSAQHLTISPTVERTIINTKAGFSTGWIYPSGWETGFFYQESVSDPGISDELLPEYFEQHYYGIYAQHQIYEFEGNILYLNIRSGLINNQRPLVAPSLRYNIILSKRISFDAGLGGASLGTGTFRPTMICGLKFRS